MDGSGAEKVLLLYTYRVDYDDGNESDDLFTVKKFNGNKDVFIRRHSFHGRCVFS